MPNEDMDDELMPVEEAERLLTNAKFNGIIANDAMLTQQRRIEKAKALLRKLGGDDAKGDG